MTTMETAWLPEGLSASVAAIVIFCSFFTSALTAAFGLGGGLALLAVMSALMPPAAVIPVHGVAQLGSNASRLLLQWKSVVRPIALWFIAGSVLGSAIGARLYVEIPGAALQALIGAFVLLSVYGPQPKAFAPGVRTFFATGAASALLSMFVGATGPIAASMLRVAALDKLKTVATHAAAMTGQHAVKTIVFGLIGFAYAEWIFVIGAIVIAGFLGAAAGTHLLHSMPEKKFRAGFTLALTFFGCYLIGSAAFDLF
ncbi:MAG TPA: sulfite exporter TauE/SafE family protein [Parvularculaceae bacterium]|nr:sulfite exporter TauE/SafE family protein [Parvularculaceae bacterium]